MVARSHVNWDSRRRQRAMASRPLRAATGKNMSGAASCMKSAVRSMRAAESTRKSSPRQATLPSSWVSPVPSTGRTQTALRKASPSASAMTPCTRRTLQRGCGRPRNTNRWRRPRGKHGHVSSGQEKVRRGWRTSRDILATSGTNARTGSLRKDEVENPSNAIATVDYSRRATQQVWYRLRPD